MAEHAAERDAPHGWFADWDDEQEGDYGWQPCLETGQGHIPCFQVWFKTKAKCEEWIAANVIGVGWFPGDPENRPIPPGVTDQPEDVDPDEGVCGPCLRGEGMGDD